MAAMLIGPMRPSVVLRARPSYSRLRLSTGNRLGGKDDPACLCGLNPKWDLVYEYSGVQVFCMLDGSGGAYVYPATTRARASTT